MKYNSDKVLVSVSGGATSGYLAATLREKHPEKEFIFVYANTGQEREETLEFLDKLDKHFKLNLVWVEAVVNKKGVGTSHRIVDFDTADRTGKRFEEVIQKFGIPNTSYPHCTRELKAAPIKTYAASIGWKDCVMAIGIRADESRRVGNDPRFIYPLNDWGVDKTDINIFWEDMPFKLELLEHEGNCSWCWKKSDKKLRMLIRDMPEIFDFPRKMEAQYGLAGSNKDGTHRKFFRKHRSTDVMFDEAALIASDTQRQPSLFDEDVSGGCGESCEPFTADTM